MDNNEHPRPFGGFSGSFSGSFGEPFANDPFSNRRNRDNRDREFGRHNNAFNVFGGMAGEHFMNQDDFGQSRTFSSSFGNRAQSNGGGGGLFDSFTRSAFGSLGGALNGSISGSWSTSMGGGSNSSFSSSSSSFSSSTRSVYRNGQWVSETTESKTVNGETKTKMKRSWTDQQVCISHPYQLTY